MKIGGGLVTAFIGGSWAELAGAGRDVTFGSRHPDEKNAAGSTPDARGDRVGDCWTGTRLGTGFIGVSPRSVPDICDLILDDHELFRRRFAELDDERQSETSVVAALWQPLAEHLERHASAEEEVFYPAVLERVDGGEHDTHHAIRDHNKIRDALRKVAASEPGSDAWWDAVGSANEENSDHMAEEERGPLSEFRQGAHQDLRKELGTRFVAFNAEHAGGRALDTDDVDPDAYVEDHATG